MKWTGRSLGGDYSGYDGDDDDNRRMMMIVKMMIMMLIVMVVVIMMTMIVRMMMMNDDGNDCVFSLSLPRDKQCVQQTRPHGEQGQYH